MGDDEEFKIVEEIKEEDVIEDKIDEIIEDPKLKKER
jgi:hypothetical protein